MREAEKVDKANAPIPRDAVLAIPAKKDERSVKHASKANLARDYIRLYQGTSVWNMSIAVIAAVGAGVPLPIISYITGEIVDQFGTDFGSVVNKVWKLLIVATAYYLSAWLYMALFSQIGMKNGVRLREEYVNAVLNSEVSQVEGRGAEISAKLGTTINLVQSGTGDKAGLLLQSISYFVCAFIVGFVRNARLTAILLPIVPVFLIIVTVGSRMTEKYTARITAATLSTTNFAQESLKNIRLLKTLNAETVLAAKFGETTAALIRDSMFRAACGAMMTGCIYLAIYLTNALAFWEGARLIVSQKQEGAGATYVVVTLVIDSSFVVGMVSPFLQIFGTAASAGSEIRHEIEKSRERYAIAEDGLILPEDFAGEITFQNVKFAYPSAPETFVLDEFNLKLQAGKLVGIVGHSGSCKSTIVNLIERFYDVQGGCIAVDGQDISTLQLSSWRKQLSLVSQEPVLFTGTIFENIASGLKKCLKKYTEEELIELVIEAAEKANVAPFIDTLEDGYQTQVGSNGGSKLSVGQRQRITLARALISEPRVLLLDEATSAVDALSEVYIAQALRVPSSRPRTTVVVAHRLTTVKDADEIIVMHEGRVLEQGTHDALVEKRGKYAEMVDIQSLHKKRHVHGGFDEEESCSISSELEDMEENDKQLTKNRDDDEVISAGSITRRIYNYCRPERKWIMLGLLSSFITGLITAADALLFGNLISAMNQVNRPDYLTSRAAFLSGFFVLVAGVACLSYTVMGSAFGVSSVKLTQRVKNQVFEHLLKAPMSYHDDEANSADRVSSRLDTDTASLGGLSGQFIGSAFSVSTSIISGIAVAHAFAPLIALVLLPAVPLIIVCGYLRLKVVAKNQRRNEVAFEGSAALASEAINSIRIVASLCLEDDFYSRYTVMLESTYHETWSYMAYSTALLALAYTLPFVIYAIAYLWGSYLVSRGNYSPKEYFIVLPALLFSAQTSGQMFSMAPDFSRATIAAKSIFRTLSEKTEDKNKVVKALPTPQGKIEFRNVSFRYPGREEYVLKDTSFLLPAGQNIAFVGRSGCGKTTIFSLLARFYEPDSGEIFIDDLSIKAYPLEELRRRISVVPQESSVFTGTIRFNLQLAKSDATDQELMVACEKAQIWDLVESLPEGLGTTLGVGSAGISLSGGQRQRLAIARSFLSHAKIILLDEPTAALDAMNEKLIDASLKAHGSGRTLIQIAHRLGGVVDSDCILVFEDGRVVQSGRHHALVDSGGLYGELVASMM